MDKRNIRNFVIISHVDHGKSTLADRFLELTGTIPKRQFREQFLDQMELEREKGITIKMQPVRMLWHPHRGTTQNGTRNNAERFRAIPRGFPRNSAPGSEYILNLIDTPGHVDFSYEVSRSLAAVEGAILLVDGTQGIQAQTLANLTLAKKQGLKIIAAINKIDLPISNINLLVEELAKIIGCESKEIFRISAKKGIGIEKLLRAVATQVPPPKGDIFAPPRALIFDSNYDPYKGVLAYVRIVDGNVTKGQEIKLMANNQNATSLEIGVFTPKLKEKDRLVAGEIGYIATGIKEPSLVRVGDTITTANSKSQMANRNLQLAISPLPGYQEPKPMVFASFYPSKAKEINSLKDALEKLKLNDASLTTVATRHDMLGQGFRLGFLGTLHLEIIKERLRREYRLEPVITLPSVLYQAITKDGQTVEVHTPQELPREEIIKEIKEPWVRAEILTPPNYLGSIMQLIQNSRGRTDKVETIGSETLIRVEIPLEKAIINFYDKLKSVSHGYASMSYEILDWRPGELAKLDILIAGERFEAFSRIVPIVEAETIGRLTIEKLKEILPREVFPVPIQAAIGSQIIARVTLSALKKDVTGHLYGGDRTRKMKLWKKQQQGKKKLTQFGRVEVPASAFFEVFKMEENV